MDKRELPENIRQAIDLIVAVLRRIKEKELDKKAEEAVHKTENFIRENEIDKKVINAGKTLENGVISVGEKLEETFNKLF